MPRPISFIHTHLPLGTAGGLAGKMLLAIMALGIAAPVSPSVAQPASRIVQEPPSAALKAIRPAARLGEAAPSAPLAARSAAPTVQRGPGTEVSYDLAIKYTEGTIYNPATDSDDKVSLRSYVGDVTNPAIPFVGPTVNIWPGETFRLTLRNQLPEKDSSCVQPVTDPNVPHCFNSTNMHTHGLWVSPTGNSDNVLLTINPNVNFQYEYNIPPDHPAGTFWYHPHLHGSTALQVSSGMSGALVIHGDRLPQALPGGLIETGDIGTLLRTPQDVPFTERLVLFQQVAYACFNADGTIKRKAGDKSPWVCDPGDVGVIKDYAQQLSPSSWDQSGRYTSINGEIIPTFTGAVVGAVERWRLIHAGVRDTIKLRFQKLNTEAVQVAYRAVSTDAKQDFIDANCGGEAISELAMAADGLTRGDIREQTETVLQPGYREDLLMVFPEPGIYCMINGEATTDETVDEQVNGRELLGYVDVQAGPGAPAGSPYEIVQNALIASAQVNMPADVRPSIIADLQNGLHLSAFIDQSNVEPGEVTGTQTLGFNIDINHTPTLFQVGTLEKLYGANEYELVDPEPYAPQRIDRTLALDGVDEWTLTSFFANHPFHIHVNPFQIVSIVRKGETADLSEPDSGTRYAGMKGVWKDTLFIEDDVVYTTRTRYRRYIGEFVLHCHILDHEDQGMMQNVSIRIPNGKGGLAGLGHH